MLKIILYIIGLIIYCGLPLNLQIPLLLINTMVPDPIPYLDEIIMYGSAIKRGAKAYMIIEWIKEHKLLAGIIVIVFIFVIAMWITS